MSALTILVIDDDPNRLRPMWGILATNGCRVRRYIEGRRTAQEIIHRFDVVLEGDTGSDELVELIRGELNTDVIALEGDALTEFVSLQQHRVSKLAAEKTQPLAVC